MSGQDQAVDSSRLVSTGQYCWRALERERDREREREGEGGRERQRERQREREKERAAAISIYKSLVSVV